MIEVKDVSLDVLSYEDNVKRCERLGWNVVPVPLREIKDCNGNAVPVITCTGKVFLTVVINISNGMVLAYKGINMQTGHYFEWFDSEYDIYGIIDKLVKIDSDMFMVDTKVGGTMQVKLAHQFSELAIVIRAIDGLPLACTNYSNDGEGHTYWVHKDYRRSQSMLFYKTIAFVCCLKYGFICKGLESVYGLVNPDNIPANKSHYSLGYKFDGEVIVNNKKWNKYSQDIESLIKNAEKFAKECGVTI
jgi:hypothetical protein